MLAATKMAGQPESHFHVPSFERWLSVYGLNDAGFTSRRDALGAVFAAAITQGMGSSDIFGLRMQRGSFDFFMKQLALLSPGPKSDVERMESVFGPTVFVHLCRSDRLDQAISLVRAEQSGLWHRNSDGSELERLSPPKEPHYDAKAIAHQMNEFAALDKAWERWFEQESLNPLRICYDELSDDPHMALASVLSALQLDPKQAPHVETPTAKLSDELSGAWRARFMAEIKRVS